MIRRRLSHAQSKIPTSVATASSKVKARIHYPTNRSEQSPFCACFSSLTQKLRSRTTDGWTHLPPPSVEVSNCLVFRSDWLDPRYLARIDLMRRIGGRWFGLVARARCPATCSSTPVWRPPVLVFGSTASSFCVVFARGSMTRGSITFHLVTSRVSVFGVQTWVQRPKSLPLLRRPFPRD